jgi:hypothetical protein
VPIPIQPWESETLRTSLSPGVQSTLRAQTHALAVPTNVAQHISNDHPKDEKYLTALGEIMQAATYLQASLDNPSKFLIYSKYDNIWFRIVIVLTNEPDAPSILVSFYRRNAVKTARAIASGKLIRINERD